MRLEDLIIDWVHGTKDYWCHGMADGEKIIYVRTPKGDKIVGWFEGNDIDVATQLGVMTNPRAEPPASYWITRTQLGQMVSRPDFFELLAKALDLAALEIYTVYGKCNEIDALRSL